VIWCGESEVSRRRFNCRATGPRDTGKCTGEERRVDHLVVCSPSLTQAPSRLDYRYSAQMLQSSLLPLPKAIGDIFSAAYTTKYPIKPTETHAAVLVPLCILNGNLGSLLEVREKLMAYSGKVRWAPSRFTFVDFHLCMLIKFPRRKGPPNRRVGVARCAAGSKK